MPTALVEQRDVTHTIRVHGVIDAARTYVVRMASDSMSKHSYRATLKLVQLAEEGSRVKVGDVIAQYDLQEEEDSLLLAQESLESAEDQLQQSQDYLKATVEKNEADLARQDQDIELAKTQLEELLAEPLADAIAKSQGNVEDAQRRLQIAREDVKTYRSLLSEGFVTPTELAETEEKLTLAELDAQKAAHQHKIVMAGATPAKLRAAEIRVEREKLVRQMLALSAESRHARAQNKVETARISYDRYQARVNQIQHTLDSFTVKSPIPGIVQVGMKYVGNGNFEKVRVGMEIWHRQMIVRILDDSRLVLKGQVAETDVRHLKPGLRARITSQTTGDKVFHGKTSRLWGGVEVATEIDTGEQRASDAPEDKVVNLIVELEGDTTKLNIASQAEAVIEVQPVPGGLVVPNVAIFGHGAERFVWCRKAAQWQAVPVQVRLTQDDEVVVEGDLAPDDQVALSQPPATDSPISTAASDAAPERISVLGFLEPLDRQVVSVPRTYAQLAWIIDDTSPVKKGDRLMSFVFDDIKLNYASRESACELSQLSVELARETAARTRREWDLQAQLAELDIQATEAQLLDFTEPMLERDVETARLAYERAKAQTRARRRAFEIKQALHSGGVATDAELTRERVRLEEAISSEHQAELELRKAKERPTPTDRELVNLEIRKNKDRADRLRRQAVTAIKEVGKELEYAVLRLKDVELDRQLAREFLAKEHLSAPCDGVVMIKKVPKHPGYKMPEMGDVYYPGSPAAMVCNFSEMGVVAPVSETAARRIREGQVADIHLLAYPDVKLKAHVVQVGALLTDRRELLTGAYVPKVDNVGTVVVRLRLEPTKVRLLPGMTARADLQVDLTN